MRKRVFITGGLIVLMLIISSNTVFAQSLKLSQEEMTAIKTEIDSGKPVKDVFKKHNITMPKIRAFLGETGQGKDHMKLSNTQIATIASKLNLDPKIIQAEIDSGKSFAQILKDNNITKSQIMTLVGEENHHLNKQMKKNKKVNKFLKASL